MPLLNNEDALRYLERATEYAVEHQTCKRKAVGCVIVGTEDRTRFAVYGNNQSRGAEFCKNIQGNCGCLHAEAVALFAALRKYPLQLVTADEVSLICNYSPCTACANLIVHSAFVDCVLYRTLTEHDKEGVELLLESGLVVEKI